MAVCKRCLLKDMNFEEYHTTILDYIESLEDRAQQELYDKRLSICRSCDNLINGMCKLCGCFVEVRAAKAKNECAKSSDIW